MLNKFCLSIKSRRCCTKFVWWRDINHCHGSSSANILQILSTWAPSLPPDEGVQENLGSKYWVVRSPERKVLVRILSCLVWSEMNVHLNALSLSLCNVKARPFKALRAPQDHSLLTTISRSMKTRNCSHDAETALMNDCPPISQNTELLPYKESPRQARSRTPAHTHRRQVLNLKSARNADCWCSFDIDILTALGL